MMPPQFVSWPILMTTDDYTVFQQDQTKAMESYLEYYYLIKALFAENINRQSTQHFDSLQ